MAKCERLEGSDLTSNNIFVGRNSQSPQ